MIKKISYANNFFHLGFIIFVFLLNICYSCSNKEIANSCIYTVEEHETKLNDSIKYKKYVDSFGFLTYDERKNKSGSVYYFQKGKLHEYVYFHDDSLWNYAEEYDTLGELKRTLNSPMVSYTFCSDSNQKIVLHINYFLLNKTIEKLILFNNKDTSEIHYFKKSKNTNMFYSSIYLRKHNKMSIIKSDYYLEYIIKNCKGKKTKYCDTIYAPDKNYKWNI